MMRVAPVELAYVNQVWPQVAPYINSALMLGVTGEALYNLDHVQAFLVSGQWDLIVAFDDTNSIKGAATIAYMNYPLHRVAFVTTIGGKGIINKDSLEQFRFILKQRGATMIQAYGRESIVRLWKRYDFKPCNTLVELPL